MRGRFKGVPVVDEMESVSQSPVGEIRATTSCSEIKLETEP